MVERTPLPAQGTVSAAEHERLRRDYDALKGQFDAADEVLTALGRSEGDPDAVLTECVLDPGVVAERNELAARALCEHGPCALLPQRLPQFS